MSEWKGRTRLAEFRMKHTWLVWLLVALIMVVGVILSYNLTAPLSSILVIVMIGVALATMPYMWYVENKLQDKLNVIRKQYGLKEVCGRESFWGYLVRD